MILRLAIAVICVLPVLAAGGQNLPSFYDYTRASLQWYTIETEHFKVHYHEDDEGRGSGRSAQEVARLAEDVYDPITTLYDYAPNTKVSIVLRDFEDYSNGAAYFFDNVIVLWTPSLDSPLRGRHDWLRNVVTHEFTHIVQVQAAMKSSRRMPFQYFQLLTYEDVRRPDVLYGYPNGIVTYPIPVLSNPAWFAEGTAQFQRGDMHFDTWDTHRDMLLRTRILEGKELSLADMGGFYSHNSLERETVYNQGFAFTQFIAATHGERALADVTRALGSWRVWNFDSAAKRALGIRGSTLYDTWIERLKDAYSNASAEITANEVSGEVIEEEGFLNIYPKYSPDGSQRAYLSNKGHDFSTVSLYVASVDESHEPVAINVGFSTLSQRAYTCALGHTVAPGVYGAFDWHPEGKRLAYAKRKDMRDGSYYADLYVYSLESKVETQVTRGERTRSPAYSNDGTKIAFVSERDGSTNLFVVHVESGDTHQITGFQNGEQLADPVWHPTRRSILVSLALGNSNDIYEIDIDSGSLVPIVATAADERNPSVAPDGEYLYYASDQSGIFNLYRQPMGSSRSEQLTNVVGGAFMPSAGRSKSVVYSQYEWDGYKIAQIIPGDAPVGSDQPQYSAPEILTKWTPTADADRATVHAGVSISSVPELQYDEPVDTDPIETDPHTNASPRQVTEDTLAGTGYSNEFTSFSFFPVLRLDQYVSRRQGRAEIRLPDRSRGETLLRNTKVGFYVASREVLEGLSMLGGLLVGPASGDPASFGDYFAPSSLIDLERDLFVQFDYRKGVFFKAKRWSPQFSLQLFNIRRNVENGLAFEELACTACFPPDTTLADLSYNLWELDLAARSKISRGVLVEAGYRFSPYRVTTERFFSTEFQQTIPASSSRYYIGRAFRAKLYVEALRPHRHGDVVRDGWTAEVSYEFEPGRLLDRFDVEDGVLAPKYESFSNHRLGIDIKYGKKLVLGGRGAAHGISVRVKGSTILGGAVDDFFDDYVGGLIGARGYPFYALGGNETLWGQVSYLVPILPRIRRQLWFVYVDKLYARLYGDAAYAWTGTFPGLSDAKRDVGGELRLALGSFYLLPTAVFVSATYGIDEFEFSLDDEFVTPDGRSSVFYGRDIQWHFGVLFGFDL